MTSTHERCRIEREIATKIVDDALAAGYSISVDNGGDEYEIKESTDKNAILAVMFATDEERVILSKDGKHHSGWVYLVYGNDGWDVVCDYSTNIKDVLAGADVLADKYEAIR